MMTIWKFPVQIADRQFVSMPSRHQILTLQMQGEQPCLWAMVDTESPRARMVIRIYGTGHPITEAPGAYIATFQTGPLVFHAFNAGPHP